MAEERGKSDVAKREEEVLAFWQQERIFEKTLEKPAPNGEFVFYDGPPFANGLPHYGHLLASTIKDAIPRYKTMRGYRVRRRWGWDTHGLPIESLVEKELGLKSKKDILELGVEKFNDIARSKVLEYVHDWKRYVERVGRFVDFDNSYKTMDPSFTESVWWALKEIHKKGRLYEGRKVLMYCPHCETPLAKAEIAMDNTYKDITEEAVTVRFKVKDPEKHGLPKNTYFLAWTTTPWTLPGNVGLAVGPDIDYVGFALGEETLIIAKELYREGSGDIAFEKKGSELVGIEYEPLYTVPKVAAHSGKKWQVLPADFVNTEDGTGVVHTAVIYGEDDYALGLKEGLPMVPLLNPNATYNDDAPEFLRGKYIKKAEADIKADLESRGLLFAKALHTHSYPHCYRCGTPLIYNAVSSWFIDIQSVKQRLLEENEKITWSPAHLKHGRFKRNLESAPDWTISRNRFWASPLPIWKDAEGNVTVIGSLEELKARTKKSGNRYFVMRHGKAENNVLSVASGHVTNQHHLTDEGKAMVAQSAAELKEKVDYIFVSPFLRTKETAEIVRSYVGLPKDAVIEDARLAELNFGMFEGKTIEEYQTAFPNNPELFSAKPEGGENEMEVKRRVGEFLYEVERTYKDKSILIVSHGDPVWMLSSVAEGANVTRMLKILEENYPVYGQIRELDFVPLPLNRDYELDFHLPFIDEVQLESEDGKPLTRIPEVVDCWVEAGSMPFAECHYPFENQAEFTKRSPGDFVSEYIGQTRAWFYYMHAMSVELFDRAPFRNVVTTGTILAADGEKLSKSKKNYTDSYTLFDTFGADAFRFYLMASVVMQAEDLQFRDEDVKEVQNRVINMVRNIHAFYGLYKDDLDEHAAPDLQAHVLDRWILARLEGTARTVTEAFERYDMPRAARPIREFIDDLSTWYVRRSRDRVKSSNEADKQAALHTLRHVLRDLSRLMAPITPFVADEIYKGVKTETDPESVHLATWPEAVKRGFFKRLFGGAPDSTDLIKGMSDVRTLASEALMLRQKANIKVRQPLAALSIPGSLSPELQALLMEELNVKEIRTGAEEVSLDTAITSELELEGDVREMVRAISGLRKEMGLHTRDTVVLTLSQDAARRFSEVDFSGVARIEEATNASHALELSIGTIFYSVTKYAA